MASYRIIVLERIQDTQRVSYHYAMWGDVPSGQESLYANPQATSAFMGISAPDLTAIQNGSVVERTGVYSREPGTPIAQVQQDLEDLWQKFQDQVTNNNKYDRYGTTWDGVSWSAGGA